MTRTARIELGAVLAAFVLAIAAGLYLVITTFLADETCYGISNAKIVCHPLTAADAAATGARMVVVLGTVWALFAASLAAAWWQGRARESGARSTAYLVLVTCAVTVVGITIPAISGVGFFFVPGTLVLIAATITGLVAWWRTQPAAPSQAS
ncbi:MAG TPA: hypothetical protein VKQ30_14030 [Ktedonobacterales bacterium]|nr:hypothetical protein [Ktedonobacterales bacterium]